jgi:hypothetical protein
MQIQGEKLVKASFSVKLPRRLHKNRDRLAFSAQTDTVHVVHNDNTVEMVVTVRGGMISFDGCEKSRGSREVIDGGGVNRQT